MEPTPKKGPGRPRRYGKKMPTMTIRLSTGSERYLQELMTQFALSNQSALVRTALDLATSDEQGLAKEIQTGFDDLSPLGVFRKGVGLASLKGPSPSITGVVSFRYEEADHDKYFSLLYRPGVHRAMILEAALRLFYKKAQQR